MPRSDRQEFTTETKRAARDRAGGQCENCGIRMRAGNGPEFDHRIPCAEGGDNSLENCDVLCRNCHGAKTKKDVPRIAKGKRIRDKADNIRARQWRPMIGTKASGIRKPMNGQVEKW